MNPITVQDLQAIAVKCTSDFFNSGVPLSEGLSKIASERNLNPEQLKRAVEATNTLTYLKSVEVGSDRTGEFPLADYNAIIKMASLPEAMLMGDFSKTASEASPPNPVDPSPSEDLVKQAEQSLQYSSPEVSQMTASELMTHLVKEASINRRALEVATDKSFQVLELLEKIASELQNAPQLGEVLSAVSKDEASFRKLAFLTQKEDLKFVDPELADLLLQKSAATNSALSKAKRLAETLEKAAELVQEIKDRTALDERATPYIEGIQKQAFLNTAIGSAGKAVGSLIGGATKATLIKPVKAVGKAAVNGFAATVDTAATKTQNWAARSSAGKAIGVTPTTVSPATLATKKRSVRNLAVAGAALDAASFTPKARPDAPASGDVWSALNG